MTEERRESPGPEQGRDWAEEADRDFSEIVTARVPPLVVTAPFTAFLVVVAIFSFADEAARILAPVLGLLVFGWAGWLRRRPLPRVAGAWAAAVLGIFAFCGGLVATVDREDPAVAVLASVGTAWIVWLAVMTLPWTRSTEEAAPDRGPD